MADRTINVAGSFKQPVDITNSLQNGYGCIANNYSHAEGFETSATGDYSYAGGYHAKASDNFSYVWSGKNDINSTFQSNGEGTYNIYVKEGSDNVLDKIYANAVSLKSRIETTFGTSFSNASLKSSSNTWTGTNTFNANITLGNGANIEGTSGSQLNFPSGSTANFQGTANAVTITDTIKDNRIATLKYVSDLFQSSISTISTNYVKRGGSTGAIGSSVKPVYINAEGNAVAISNNVVTRGDNTTEGSSARFVYMDGGSITPSTGTIGDDGKTIVYLNNGTLTESNVNVGTDNEGKTITYLKSGKITQSTATVGSTLVPVFLSSGVITPFTTNKNIGGPTQPIYLKGGSITVCSSYPAGGGTGKVLTNLLLTTEGDYNDPKGTIGATGNNFIKTLTGYVDTNGTVILKGTTDRPSINNINGLDSSLHYITSSLTTISSSCSNLEASLVNYAPKFNVKVSGTGNVISSVTFENNSASINLQKNVTALTAARMSGTGTVLTSLAISGSTVEGTLGYPPISITRTPTSGNVVASIGYSNGTITEYRTDISSGGGYPPINYLIKRTWPCNKVTVKASSHVETSTNVTLNGYTPIAIAGFRSKDRDSPTIVACGAYLNDLVAYVCLQKVFGTSNNQQAAADVDVLYIKS